MMQVIKLASSTEFTTKIRKVSNFCTEVIHFKLEALSCAFCYEQFGSDDLEWVECSCGRWVHEECIEDILTDDDGNEKFCPFCIN